MKNLIWISIAVVIFVVIRPTRDKNYWGLKDLRIWPPKSRLVYPDGRIFED